MCDVGGGTTDFSLIRVRIEAGAPTFERMAIGDHLLLGGDNVDLALAALVERKIAELRPRMRLAITQRAALRRLCSAAKERMLGEAVPDRVPITVLGAGRAVVGDSITARSDARRGGDDAERVPAGHGLRRSEPADAIGARACASSGCRTKPTRRSRVTWPAISRALRGRVSARSPRRPSRSPGGAVIRPDLVLFNGGFFAPAVARERVAQALARWFGDAPPLLATGNLEAAVAVGAATYARLRAGIGRAGALVKAGSGRAYYVALRAPLTDEAIAAVCVLARGTEEGTEQTFDHPFTVATNRPISFSLYSSTTRPDRAGEIVSLRPGVDAQEHAPLVTVFRYGRKSRHVELPVRLSVAFTEVGTLELWCRSETSEHRWRCSFRCVTPRRTSRQTGDGNRRRT